VRGQIGHAGFGGAPHRHPSTGLGPAAAGLELLRGHFGGDLFGEVVDAPDAEGFDALLREPLVDLGALVGIEVGAGVGDHGDLLLVEHPGGEHLLDQGVAGVQITGDADPFAPFMGGDPAGDADPVGHDPLYLPGIIYA
jgi:hypothetical protein